MGDQTRVNSSLSQLSDKGKKVFLRIKPNFISSSPVVQNTNTRNLFAKKKDTEDIALNSRFQNNFALLDIFNPEAQSWLSNQLAAVKISGNVY
ncbi:MAG: alpha-glucosidase (family GH31 glycosyl hydrolase) [Spirosomataceae bacterium]